MVTGSNFVCPRFALLCLCVGAAILQCVNGQPSFIQEPANTTVVAGGEAIIYCGISNIDPSWGFLWTKGNNVLPLDRDIPNNPRYSIIGDPASEGNLRIQNAQLEDDNTYKCQVPGLYSRLVTLTVQVPPDPPTMDNYPNGTVITVDPPAAVVLACRANAGRPAATVAWMKNGNPVLYLEPAVTETSAGDPLGKKCNLVSSLTVQPEKEDNGVVYKCLVEHPALVRPYFLTVALNVRFPPSGPMISGYQRGVAVTQGDNLSLECMSIGGNPLAEVYWWKNGVQMDHSYITDERRAWNTLPITVGFLDNNVVYKCQVSSVVLPEPLTDQIELTVHFPPAYVNITGHENLVNSHSTVTLQCKSAISNPSASIIWYSGNQRVSTSPDVVTPDPRGGFVTSQNLTVTLTGDTDTVDYMCEATNRELNQQANAVATISVMNPPEPPFISGYEEGREVKAGNVLRLTCTAIGGNPLASLTWYKNGAEVAGDYRQSTRLAKSILLLNLEKTDNKANYSCSASNQATPTPLVDFVLLEVLFPPDRVFVTAEPPQSREGDRVVVKCRTASSSPASELTWWRDGEPIEGSEAAIEPSDNSGFSTSSELVIESVSLADNGRVFLCRAKNELIVEAVNDGLKMDVRFKPQITVADQLSVSTREGPGLQILNCTARGNPETLTYVWHQNGAPVVLEGSARFALNETSGSLLVHNATRTENGKYMCLVSNEEGTSNVTVTLDIQYSPVITTGERLTINLYSLVELVCQADASPRPDDFIKWSRDGFDLGAHQAEYRDGKAILRILNVSKADGGFYTCQADNGIAPAFVKNVQVVVQYVPQVDHSIPNKVAQSVGQTAVLRCRAEGAPVVRFKWLQESTEVNLTSKHYAVDTRPDLTYSNSYDSRLYISPVNEDYDYGKYVCKAYNDLGEMSFAVHLEQTSAPEAPSALTVLHIKDSSVKLSWEPGFDGGRPQTFQVRFNQKGELQFQYVDVPPEATSYTVTNLNPETTYEFTVRGRNDLGMGSYYMGIVTATTKVAPARPVAPGPSGILVGNIPLYLFLLVTFLSLLSCVFINIFLVCCLCKRKTSKRRMLAKKSDIQLKSKIQHVHSDKDSLTLSETVDGSSVQDRSEYTKGAYSDDERSYDDRRYGDRSYDDYSDRAYDDGGGQRPASPSRREAGTGYHNRGYRPPSYSASWDSYGQERTPSIMTDQVSEDLEERSYADQLRRKQAQLTPTPSTPVPPAPPARPYEYQPSVTPSPVPSSLGNFVQLSKGRQLDSQAGSEEGFLV